MLERLAAAERSLKFVGCTHALSLTFNQTSQNCHLQNDVLILTHKTAQSLPLLLIVSTTQLLVSRPASEPGNSWDADRILRGFSDLLVDWPKLHPHLFCGHNFPCAGPVVDGTGMVIHHRCLQHMEFPGYAQGEMSLSRKQVWYLSK